MDNKEKIKKLLEDISNNKKYSGCIFSGGGNYFIIDDGELIAMSADGGYDPHGGWFPAIVSGPTEEEDKCLTSMMEENDFDEFFFSEMISDYGYFDADCVLEYFEDNEDKESIKIYKKIKKKIESGKTPFETMGDFVDALGRYGLDSNGLYYEWEGEYIDLYENICDVGTAMEFYDSADEEMWIKILENIDDHIV